jgi:hypothetical protein
METIVVHPKNQKQLAAVEAVLKALNVTFKKEEERLLYNPEFIAKMKQSDQDVKAGRTTKIEPADIWNLG